jgi:hypothetical protein
MRSAGSCCSVKRAEPEWDLLPVPRLRNLPALQWKLTNVGRLSRVRRKHAEAIDRLRAVLGL